MLACTFCDGWNKDCKICKGTGEAHRFDQALEYYPNIKSLGLTVTDYNCTWYVNADLLEKKLSELDKIIAELKNAIESHFGNL